MKNCIEEQKTERLIIGDIHRRNTWKKILEKHPNWTEAVFLGDYSDTHDRGESDDFYEVLAQETEENFKDLIELKKSRPKDTHLMFGNHDYQYVRRVRMSNMYSNYSYRTDAVMRKLYEENMHLLELIYAVDGVLFSHAGVSTEWLSYIYGKGFDIKNLYGPLSELKETLSDYCSDPYNMLELNYASGYEPHGDTPTQSPVWIRPASLWDNMYLDENIKCQIVGHTPTISGEPVHLQKDGKELWLCDTLEDGWYLMQTEKEILKLNINETV